MDMRCFNRFNNGYTLSRPEYHTPHHASPPPYGYCLQIASVHFEENSSSQRTGRLNTLSGHRTRSSRKSNIPLNREEVILN